MKNILTLLLVICGNFVFAQANTAGINGQQPKDLTAIVAGSAGGKISTALFKTARKIEVTGPDTSAAVTAYTIYFKEKGFEATPGYLPGIKGNLFTKDIIRLLEKCKPGTIVIIDDIKVISGNVVRKVPTLHFTLY